MKVKNKPIKKDTKVWLMCAETDTGEYPAINPLSFSFLSAKVLSYEPDEDGDKGYWLEIEDQQTSSGTYNAWYSEKFVLTQSQYEKFKTLLEC